MERLGQYQAESGTPVMRAIPLRDNADNPHHNQQKLPVADERLVRNVRVGQRLQ